MGELNLNDLAVFVRVVDRGGFASAARELGLATSTVSRTAARLESMSGTRLLQRTTRSVRPTAEGRDLYASTAAAVGALRGAARAFEPAARRPKGRLRVAAPNDLCTGFLADVIVAFAERYPLVQLDFTLTDRRENLVDGGFDVALRAAVSLDDSTMVARKVGQIEHRLYASPEYLARHGAPASVEELRDHRCVVFRAKELEVTKRARSGERSHTISRSSVAKRKSSSTSRSASQTTSSPRWPSNAVAAGPSRRSHASNSGRRPGRIVRRTATLTGASLAPSLTAYEVNA